MYIDTHAHLYDKKFSTDFPRMIQRALESGVERIVVIGEDLETSRKVVAMANRASVFSATIGVHPHHAKTYSDAVEKYFEQTSEDPKVVAIGETGLDYYHENSPREIQAEVLRRQMRLARRCGLPLVLHVRNAYEDLLKIFKEEKANEIGGVVHCFSSDYKDARAILDFGFYLGVGGAVTYSNAQVLQEVVRKVPIERILLETDAPYLAPAPKRGRRNEPSFLKYTARQIAELKKLKIQDVARITKLNALKVYRLPKRLEPQVAYPIENCLYLNITNHCTNHCYFCHRGGDFVIKGHYLKLKAEPTVEEIKTAIGDGEVLDRYEEVSFCGAGEATLRLDVVIEIAKWLKKKGLRVRL
ncbi:MAG: TatD family hydrolase, partial [bacterium]